MILIVKLIGIIVMSLAILIIIHPDIVNRIAGFFGEGSRCYIAGVVRIIFGSFLLIEASNCKHAMVIIIIGGILLASGLAVFLIGLERSKSYLARLSSVSPASKRVLALTPLLIGILLIYAA